MRPGFASKASSFLFTPGFSQVTHGGHPIGNRLNGTYIVDSPNAEGVCEFQPRATPWGKGQLDSRTLKEFARSLPKRTNRAKQKNFANVVSFGNSFRVQKLDWPFPQGVALGWDLRTPSALSLISRVSELYNCRLNGFPMISRFCSTWQKESVEKLISVPLCDLCASVVSVFWSNFTTETQRIFTEAQRRAFFRQTVEARCE